MVVPLLLATLGLTIVCRYCLHGLSCRPVSAEPPLMQLPNQGPRRFRGLSRPLRPPDAQLAGVPHTARPASFEGEGAVVFGSMDERSTQRSDDLDGERVRRLRLRADGQRPLAVNLEETILLARKLFELRDAARRAR